MKDVYSSIVVYRFLLGLVCLYCFSILSVPLFFCLVVLSILEGGDLKSPAIFVELYISPFNYFSFDYIYFGAVLVEYMFIIVMSS